MKVANRLKMTEDKRLFKPDGRLLLPDCRLGLEFEWEGTGTVYEAQSLPTSDWSHYYRWHEERSLRNQGSELVFAEPLFGGDAIKAIEGLCSFARKNRWQSTLRTGIHVHVDVRDLTLAQLVGLCLLYALYEKPIFNWIGDNRENNHFCLPWYKAEGSLLQATQIIKAVNIEDPERDAEEGDPLFVAADQYERYAGFNLNALSRFGSAEARHLKTTHDTQRIVNWVNILLALKRATFNIPTSDGALIAMIQNQGARQAARNLFGEDIFALLDYPGFENDVQGIGVGVADELAREGLSKELWNILALPQGEHKGFKRFLEKKERPKVEPPAAGLIEQPLVDGMIQNLVFEPAVRAIQVRRVQVNAPYRLQHQQQDMRIAYQELRDRYQINDGALPPQAENRPWIPGRQYNIIQDVPVVLGGQEVPALDEAPPILDDDIIAEEYWEQVEGDENDDLDAPFGNDYTP